MGTTLVASLALASCGARPGPRPATDCGRPIGGTRADLVSVSGVEGAPVFAEPITCAGGARSGTYIEISREEGARTITFERRGVGACDVPDADPVQCPDVTVDALGNAVLEELRKDLGDTRADGFGLGACADASSPLTEWHLGSQIHDWRDADRALAITAATLARWNVRGVWGLSITAISCGFAELAGSSD